MLGSRILIYTAFFINFVKMIEMCEDVNKGKKSTDAEYNKRINEVFDLVLRGFNRPDILRYASKWKVSSRTVDTYLSEASKMIENTFGQRKKEELINDTLAKLSNLYVKNYELEDFKECRGILETRNKLLGLNEADLLKLQGDEENPITIKQITGMEIL